MKKEDVQKRMSKSGVINYTEDKIKKKLEYTIDDKITFHKEDVEISKQLTVDYIMYKEINSVKER